MSSGQRRLGIRPAKWRIDIPIDIAFRFERLPGNYDPTYQRPVFGRRSQIITQLLEAYILSEETKLARSALEKPNA